MRFASTTPKALPTRMQRLDPEQLPLKLRALLMALAEAMSWGGGIWDADGKPSKSKAPDTRRVREYHRGSTRNKQPGFGDWLANSHSNEGGQYHNWCSSFVGWCEREAAADGETTPPSRAAVREVVDDAMRGLRGLRMMASDVRAGFVFPPPGSLAILKRQGGMHIERVMWSATDSYLSIGGNEVTRPGVLNIEWRDYDDADLLMFLECDPLTDDELFTLGLLVNELEPPRETWIRGIDVSAYQNPTRFDWPLVASRAQFVIYRAAWGISIDETAVRHRAGAKSVGMAHGPYVWPDQRIRSVDAQLDVILRELAAARLGPGDIVPHIDVEPPPKLSLDVEWWRDALPVIRSRIRAEYGQSGNYTNRRDAILLGAGPWQRDPLWLATHTTAPFPMQPLGWSPWAMWQHAGDAHPKQGIPAGTIAGYGSGQLPIDLNLARYIPRLA